MTKILIPKLNPNDDEVKIIKLNYASLDYVEAGEIIAIAETMKTTLEISTENSGYIVYFSKLNDMARVEGVIAQIFDSLEFASSLHNGMNESITDRMITKKAQALIEKFGVDIDCLPSGVPITEKLINEFLTDSKISQNNDELGHLALTNAQVAAIQNMRQSRANSIECYMFSRWPSLASMNSPASQFLDVVISVIAASYPKYPKLFNTLGNDGRSLKKVDAVGYVVEKDDSLYIQTVPLDVATDIRATADFRLGRQMDIFRGELMISNEFAPVIISVINSSTVSCHAPVLFPGANLMLGLVVDNANLKKPMEVAVTYDHRYIYGQYVANFIDDLSRNIFS